MRIILFNKNNEHIIHDNNACGRTYVWRMNSFFSLLLRLSIGKQACHKINERMKFELCVRISQIAVINSSFGTHQYGFGERRLCTCLKRNSRTWFWWKTRRKTTIRNLRKNIHIYYQCRIWLIYAKSPRLLD